MRDEPHTHDITRRSLIIAGGTGLAITLSGCTGEEPNEQPEAEPTEPTEEEEEEQEQEQETQEEEEEEEEEELPDPTETENALVGPATLKEWQDAGLVNMEETDGRERVVVLRVWDTDAYEDGHVPGAVPWGSLHAERVEGLAETAPMVATGEQIDEMLARAGVCSKTSIVLSGPNPLRSARAYWTLRYWGFPRERVKILNGGYYEYGQEYELETGGEPDVPTTGFSVQANGELNNHLRLGMAQMLQRVDLINDGERDDVILENRTPEPGVTIQHAQWDHPANYHEGDDYYTPYAEGGRWKSADDIEMYVTGELGISSDDTVITYCGSGYRAAMSFFALDGVLGFDDVSLYDGSFSRQWMHYTDTADPTPNDAWRTDINDRTNGELPGSDPDTISIDPDLNEELTDLTVPEANQVEQADLEYIGDVGDDGGDWGCPSLAGGIAD